MGNSILRTLKSLMVAEKDLLVFCLGDRSLAAGFRNMSGRRAEVSPFIEQRLSLNLGSNMALASVSVPVSLVRLSRGNPPGFCCDWEGQSGRGLGQLVTNLLPASASVPPVLGSVVPSTMDHF